MSGRGRIFRGHLLAGMSGTAILVGGCTTLTQPVPEVVVCDDTAEPDCGDEGVSVEVVDE